jgi:hypothetical protein
VNVSIAIVATALVSQALYAADVSRVKVVLPEGTEWVAATDQSDGNQYLREWLPKGMTFDTTDWMIVEQKLLLPRKASAREYLIGVFSGAKSVCTSVKFNGPESFSADAVDSVVGRFMCAQQNGKPYGTFTDQRVIVDGKFVYVVTSELRTPPASVAGNLSFGPSQLDKMRDFMQRQALSASTVRSSVSLCERKQDPC